VNDYVSAFWIRADLEDPVFIGDEVRRWPANIRHLFESHSLIRQSENLDVVECDACGDGHVEEVEILTEPPGTKPRAYICCPEAGRVSVEFERLQQWSVDLEALARTIAKALDLRDKIVSITPGRIWLLGTRKFVERMQDVFLVRGINWPDNRQLLESATRLATSPCPLIFCLNRFPNDTEWQDRNRIVLSLSETSWLGDGQSTLLDKVSAVLSEYAASRPPTQGDQAPILIAASERNEPKAAQQQPFEGLPAKKQDLGRYFHGLTDRQHDCASLKWEHGLSDLDIARRLGLHHSTIQEHLEAARKRMEAARNSEKKQKVSAKFKPGRLNEED
jgi:DNA-binding CsgD family transcriptional regulator